MIEHSSSFNDSICITDTALPPAGLQCFSSLLPSPLHPHLRVPLCFPEDLFSRGLTRSWSPGLLSLCSARSGGTWRGVEWSTSLGWGASLELPDPNKGNRAARLASHRWAQQLLRPSRLRALQVSRGEAGGTDREEECKGALRGSPSCPGRSRRPGLRMSVVGPGEGPPWPPLRTPACAPITNPRVRGPQELYL